MSIFFIKHNCLKVSLLAVCVDNKNTISLFIINRILSDINIMMSLNEWIDLLSSGKATIETQMIVTAGVVIVALLVLLIYENWVRIAIEKFIWRSKNTWDDFVFSDKVMRAVGYFIPFMIVYMALPYCVSSDAFFYEIARRVLLSCLVLITTFVGGRLISGVNEKIQSSDKNNRPTAGIFQMIALVMWCLSAIIVVAILIDKSPWKLLAGLGGAAALMMLVFQDTIKGLVAGVQLAVYDMVHVGDWIVLEKYGINGSVQEVTLNVVKVRNWDNSVGTIPPYVLMTDSFLNYNKMSQEMARRIAVELLVDFNSVRLASPELEKSLKEKGLYVAPGEVIADVEDERLVNLTLFSRYVEKYLASQPFVRTEKYFMVRVRKPAPTGLPVEIYCYVSNSEWKLFEHTQSRVIEHIIAVMPEFGLRIFQSPSGMDIASLKH